MSHPETRAGEVFLGNYLNVGWDNMSAQDRAAGPEGIGYNTKRVGEHAFSKDGRIIPDMIPVFVQQTEIRERLGLKRLAELVAEEARSTYPKT